MILTIILISIILNIKVFIKNKTDKQYLENNAVHLFRWSWFITTILSMIFILTYLMVRI